MVKLSNLYEKRQRCNVPKQGIKIKLHCLMTINLPKLHHLILKNTAKKFYEQFIQRKQRTLTSIISL